MKKTANMTKWESFGRWLFVIFVSPFIAVDAIVRFFRGKGK